MRRQLISKIIYSMLCAACLFPNVSQAIEGTVPTGYGARSLGMGGTAVANPQDSLVQATNPAGISFLRQRFDGDLEWFSPCRAYSYTGGPNFPGDYVVSQRTEFLIPAAGVIKHIDDRNSLGVAVFGHGGLNTTYPRDNPVFGNGKINQVLELDYIQMFLTPTYSRAIGCKHAIAVSLVCGFQRLRIKGLQGFQAFSSSPNNVTNRGFSWAAGLGARIGWMGELLPNVKFGIAYATKVYMTKFHRYKGLIAEHGKLDSPAEFQAGLSWQLGEKLLLAFDFQHIFFKDVKALGHKISRIAPGNLGTNEGAGFGWKNTSYYKVGMNYIFNPCWEVRAGYAYGKVPFPSSEIDANILAPTVIKHHLGTGLTYHISDCDELDLAYMFGFENHKQGISAFGLGKVKLDLYQHSVNVHYTRFF